MACSRPVSRASASSHSICQVNQSSGRLPKYRAKRRAVSTVIPGMRSVRHAEANCGLSGMGPLDGETMAILRRHAWEKNFYGV